MKLHEAEAATHYKPEKAYGSSREGGTLGGYRIFLHARYTDDRGSLLVLPKGISVHASWEASGGRRYARQKCD